MTDSTIPTSQRSRILVTIGTRPEAIKLAPVIRELKRCSWAEVRILVTAQHRALLDQVLTFFGISADVDLNLMKPDQSLADLTARMIGAVDVVLAQEKPDIVIAQGDTTTVMVAALCCFYRRIAFGHVEAGLRTHEPYSPFPEEINRVLASRLANIHFAPTEGAKANLLAEGVEEGRITVTGNTVIDALLWTAGQDLPRMFEDVGDRRIILVTAHRRESFGLPLKEICAALRELAELREVEIVFPVHPNPNVVSVVERELRDRPHIRLMRPMSYPELVATMKACSLILTDSGGIQEEAPSLGKPVLVLRDHTERPEAVAAGTACVVGPHRREIVPKVLELLDIDEAYQAMVRADNPFGDGHAAERIVAAVAAFLAKEAWSC
ncbi:MAG: UDP-N-acetylglucosamine 2-epimerase (non-hydrolyzing) [Planctomycetota bacterium]